MVHQDLRYKLGHTQRGLTEWLEQKNMSVGYLNGSGLLIAPKLSLQWCKFDNHLFVFDVAGCGLVDRAGTCHMTKCP